LLSTVKFTYKGQVTISSVEWNLKGHVTFLTVTIASLQSRDHI